MTDAATKLAPAVSGSVAAKRCDGVNCGLKPVIATPTLSFSVAGRRRLFCAESAAARSSSRLSKSTPASSFVAADLLHATRAAGSSSRREALPNVSFRNDDVSILYFARTAETAFQTLSASIFWKTLSEETSSSAAAPAKGAAPKGAVPSLASAEPGRALYSPYMSIPASPTRIAPFADERPFASSISSALKGHPPFSAASFFTAASKTGERSSIALGSISKRTTSPFMGFTSCETSASASATCPGLSLAAAHLPFFEKAMYVKPSSPASNGDPFTRTIPFVSIAPSCILTNSSFGSAIGYTSAYSRTSSRPSSSFSPPPAALPSASASRKRANDIDAPWRIGPKKSLPGS